MNVLNMIVLLQSKYGMPSATGANSQSVAIDVDAMTTTVTTEVESTFLSSLYKWAFSFYKTLLDMMQFNGVTDAGTVFLFGTVKDPNNMKSAGDCQAQWHEIWNLVKIFFEALLNLSIPIATVFFLIAIYKSVITKPADEQAKELVVNIIRYVVILVLSLHLFDIMEWLTKLTESITSTFSSGHYNANKQFLQSGLNEINSALKAYSPPSVKSLFDGNVREFCDAIFTYVLYFLGGLLTIVVFVGAGYSMLMATINRIVKPIMMVPFSAIVLGMGVCSGEGERMIWRFARNFIGLCLSGVFILIVLKFTPYLEKIPLFQFTKLAGNSPESKAIMAIFQINLPVVLTAGLVKSADIFMSKIF